MALKQDGNGAMAEELPDESEDSAEEVSRRKSKAPVPSYQPMKTGKKEDEKQGFFTIYKPGHGYWTRMGTAGGAALIAALSTAFLYQHVPVWLTSAHVDSQKIKSINLAICAAFIVLFALFTFVMTNKPRNAEFLIATDTEMKKVNWTSRAELIGSTKVVIFFMLLIAFLLFGFDVLFGYFFYFIHVLNQPPF
jgi:preprotein translocase subunit SecE